MTENALQYSSAKLKKFKSILTSKLLTTDEDLQKRKADLQKQKQKLASTNVDFNENSKHFQQQAKNKQLIRRLQRKARELRNALERIENKTYGVCERTGALIREERLLAMPTARFDINTKR